MSSLYVFPNFKYLSKYFAQIYRAQYGAAMLVYPRSTPVIVLTGKLASKQRQDNCNTTLYLKTKN